MFERTARAGLGLAWDSSIVSDSQLANTPVGMLRLTNNLRPTFESWLREKYPAEFGHDPHLRAAYPPRRYFGEYVNSVCDALAKQPGIEVQTNMEAVRVDGTGPYAVTFKNADDKTSIVHADAVVLCTGAPANGGRSPFAQLSHHPGYLDSPWPASTVTATLRAASRVAIIGTGLTAVDTAKHINQVFPRLPVLMASRRGRLNVVSRDLRRKEIYAQPAHERRVITDDLIASLPDRIALEQLRDLINREVEPTLGHLKWEAVRRTNKDGVREWRSHVLAHRAGKPQRWQLALAAVEDVFPQLWQKLGDDDRARWNASEDRLVFQNYANPLPVESAAQLIERIDAGLVRIEGGLRGVEALDGRGFSLKLGRAGEVSRCEHVSHCINCTGIGFDASKDASRLMRQMLSDGLVQPHASGGLDLCPATLQARGARGLTEALYVTGHNTKGTRYLTSGVGFLRAMARVIASDVAARLASCQAGLVA